ncbi:MAG: UxaA family hydrolase [Gammaproteobacteria bacterium]
MSILRLHTDDNVAIALQSLRQGATVNGTQVIGEVPAMHKIAVASIARGDVVMKYRQAIGAATRDIAPGEHVHSHNCAMLHKRQASVPGHRARATDFVEPDKRARFNGFRRNSGRVGTRNYIGIVTSVNCSATVAKQIVAQAERDGLAEPFDQIDGFVAITHGTGCGMQSSGDGFELLRRTLDGYIQHANFGGVLVIGLGCEVMQLGKLSDGPGVRKLSIQEAGGTRAAITRGLELVGELLEHAGQFRREPCPASALTLALQCGGSDAYSGITANPALGVAADILVRNGGRTILSETPEIYGAEHLLVERARSAAVAQDLLERVDWWRDYAARFGDTLDSNPSPGNLAGGITTILEKSLGAQAKSGSTNLNAVIAYAAPVTEEGFVFMDSPGFDPASVTGQVAAGANVICFTTGRGSAFGFKPVPSLKLATNTSVFERMNEDMDINCGTIVDRVESVADCGQRIFDHLIAVASGQKSCSEALGYGDNEFTPWQLGAVY